MPNQWVASKDQSILLCQICNLITSSEVEVSWGWLRVLPLLKIRRCDLSKLIPIEKNVFVGCIDQVFIVCSSSKIFPLGGRKLVKLSKGGRQQGHSWKDIHNTHIECLTLRQLR